MAHIPFTPPPPPDPSTLVNPPPFAPFPITPLRAGKIRPAFSKPGMTSAIHKRPLPFPASITLAGVAGDEHAYVPHRAADKAVHQYSAAHYARWAAELPGSAAHFAPGAFGENVCSAAVDETGVCIGDRVAVGDEVVLEVAEPRNPCYKLNHRFQVRDMAVRVQTLLRTGWLYRVIRPGTVHEGDMVRLVERPHPQWTVARLSYYLYLDVNNREMMEEMAALPQLGEEIRDRLQRRLKKGMVEDQLGRLVGLKEEMMDTWADYKIVDKRKETKSITAFVFEAVEKMQEKDIEVVGPGSHVRFKLGGKLVRAYSVVGGTSQRFEVAVALESSSRGGSKYLHETANVGDVLTVSRITASFPLIESADRHILIAGGVGITAFLAATNYLQQKNLAYELHFAVADEVPYAARIEALGTNAKTYSKAKGQRMDIKSILSRADPRTHVYCCGPTRLMDGVSESANSLSIPPSSVHFEAFTVTTSGDPFSVELKRSGKSLEVGPTQSLLDALRDAGLDIPSSCEVGNCGTCRVEVCGGRVEHQGTGLLEEEKGEAMLTCVSRGVGRIVLDM